MHRCQNTFINYQADLTISWFTFTSNMPDQLVPCDFPLSALRKFLSLFVWRIFNLIYFNAIILHFPSLFLGTPI